MADELLKISDFSASYGDENVVRHIELSLKRGEILCVAGESGSGKSTILKAICGVGNVICQAGSIMYDGKVIVSPEIKKKKEKRNILGRMIGMIPQNPEGSFNPLRRFDVQFKETLKANKIKYNENEILDIFESVGLSDGASILKSRPFEMSGGMNQRISIAAIMMLRPLLLLCDEATSALDVTSSNKVVDMLLDYRKREGVGIFMVTHHLGIAKKMADNIGIMKNGELIEYNDTESVFKSPKEDYTKALIASVPSIKR